MSPVAIDARLAHDVWLQLISDEELYRAMLDGTHHALAASRALGDRELAVLDALRAEKGTRWNIENLRFRTALECGATLTSYLPRTVRMLTNGDENWLQDVCFEYLAYFRWKEHGHFRFTECERFATYVRERIMKRRITPPHLEVVLDFELAVIRLLKRTAALPPPWPAPPVLDDDALAAARLGRGRAVEVITLPVDIRAWVESGDPLRGEVRPAPVTFLAVVPSLDQPHRLKILGEGPALVLDQLTGERPTGELAAALEDEYGLEASALYAMLRGWLAERVVEVVAAPASACPAA